MLVLNKIDLVDAWRVQDAELEAITSLGAPKIRASALTGEGVEDAFVRLAESLLS